MFSCGITSGGEELIMDFCIVASNYPTETNHVHIFLQNIVTEFVNKGNSCTVIAPQSIYAYLFKRKKNRQLSSVRTTEADDTYCVYSPLYMVLPKKTLFGYKLADLTKKSFTRAVKRVYYKKGLKADVVYSHFMHAGISAVSLANEIGVSSYIANGEADTIGSMSYLSSGIVKQALEHVTGVISVSKKNKEEVTTLAASNPNILSKTIVLPNAIDAKRFYKKDQAKCRKKLGFPENVFIVSFTGSFIERKGSDRLARAVEQSDDIYTIFIGQGQNPPKSKATLFCGKLRNEEIVDYLNASDVFVLPTLAEGCSNAIVEAIACGLPIISSDLPFNDDILDNSLSIRVDPMNVDQIHQAIVKLKDNPLLRQQMADAAEKQGKRMSLVARADNVLKFIEKTMI